MTYRRLKNGQPAQIQINEALAAVLHRRPTTGPLRLYLTTVREIDCANEFRQRCEGLKISGVTLHSYRYRKDPLSPTGQPRVRKSATVSPMRMASQKNPAKAKSRTRPDPSRNRMK